MKVQLGILYQLQQLEQQKNIILSQKAKVDSEEVRRLWQEIRQLGQTVTDNKQTLAVLEKTCAKQESELAALVEQAKQLEARLYGGEITNLKELEQTRDNSERLLKDIIRRENEVFASIESCEQLTARTTADETLLLQKKRQHAERQQLMAQTLAGHDSRLAELEAEQRNLSSQVEAGLLKKFRDLARKTPLPVAKVANGVCGGCRMNIPTNQTAVSLTTIVHCDNCGRILFWE